MPHPTPTHLIDDPDVDKTPEVKEAKDPIGVADEVDPALTKDINNKLQEQGIGSRQDPFSTKIHIVGHTLRKGNLIFMCTFGGTLGNTKVPFDGLKVDVPAAVANYILLHRVGKSATDKEICKYYDGQVNSYLASGELSNRLTKAGPGPRKKKKSLNR